MVRALLLAMTREVRGMHEAAYVLAGFALLSQILALLRDRLLAGSFGASATLDVYYAAFRIPDLLFATVASLLSLYALLPVLSRLEQESPSYLISLLRRSLLAFFAAMAVMSGILFIAAPLLLPVVAPGIDDPALLGLMRILLLQPILLGASNIFAALTQLRNRFLIYSVSPLLYNIGIIVGIVFFYPLVGIAGLGWGVVLGALLHLLVQMPAFFAEREGPPLPVGRTVPSILEVLKLSVPRTAALAAGQLSILILVAMASFFTVGSIAVFMFAFNLQAVPLTIIGVSYSVAAFPTLARLYAAGERAQFLLQIETALRHILFWAIPATVLVIVLRAQLVRAILGAGVFDWDATRLTAAALALFVLSLVAQALVLLLSRVYYAAGVTSMPLRWAGLSVVVAAGSSLLLLAAFEHSAMVRMFFEALLRVRGIAGTEVLVVALGFALGSIVQAAYAMRSFVRDFGISMQPLRRLAFESGGASIVGGAAAYGTLSLVGGVIDITTTLGIVSEGIVAGAVGLLATALVLVLLNNRELRETAAAFGARFREVPPVAVEPTDVS
jgi:putative peptidoglycan lipid II flippase